MNFCIFQVHYKTFDGKVYSFQSDCSHVLVNDVISSTFSIAYGLPSKCRTIECKKSIIISVENFVYEIDTDGKYPVLILCLYRQFVIYERVFIFCF